MSFVLVGAAFLAGLLMSWAIGATNAPVFGPVNAAGATSVYRGSILIGVASLLGAVTQGGAVADTVGNRIITGTVLSPWVAAILLFVASSLVIASTLSSIPMPSAFLVVGGTLGAGIAVGGTPDLSVVGLIAGFWLLIPVVALLIGYGAAYVLRYVVAQTPRNNRRIRRFLLVLGTFTAYTAGANQAGLPIGPLMHVVDLPLTYLLLFAGMGMLVGAFSGSPRIIAAVSQEYSRMGPRRAVGALLAAGSIAQVATIVGVPISFGQAVIFSVVGAGLVEGEGGMATGKLVRTAGAWAIALTVAFLTTYAIARVLLLV